MRLTAVYDGQRDKAILRTNMERRLDRLIRHGDVLGAKRTLARLRQPGLDHVKESLRSAEQLIGDLDNRGEFCLYGVSFSEMADKRSI